MSTTPPRVQNRDFFNKHIEDLNSHKILFTPGPASLSSHNLEGLGPCFGRGDKEYELLENQVLESLRAMTGHNQIIRLQGSASLALEIVALNFLFGSVVIVNTGYYSSRLFQLAKQARSSLGKITRVILVPWQNLSEAIIKADWVWACPTETSIGLKISIPDLANFARSNHARLALDATASVGLEGSHEEAEVIAYSSCKGLFGLTGAAFVAFNEDPSNEVNSFNLDLESHSQKKMTGPYHAIQSLFHILPVHAELRTAVLNNKERFLTEMASHLVWPEKNQPLLCTQVSVRLESKSGRAVLYQPRSILSGTIVSHLGEVHLGTDARGKILEDLEIVD